MVTEGLSHHRQFLFFNISCQIKKGARDFAEFSLFYFAVAPVNYLYRSILLSRWPLDLISEASSEVFSKQIFLAKWSSGLVIHAKAFLRVLNFLCVQFDLFVSKTWLHKLLQLKTRPRIHIHIKMDLFIYVFISCYMRFLREISGVDFILNLRLWLRIMIVRSTTC